MTVEELKALLDEGKLSQEEYDQKVAELQGQGSDPNDTKDTKKQDIDLEQILKSDALQKMIQSEVDKVRTKYVTEKKDLEKQLDELRQKDLSKEDLLKLKENNLRDFETKLKRKELDFDTVKLLEEKQLPTAILSYIPGDSIEERTEHLTKLTSIIDDFTTAKAESRFKSQSRDFQQGNQQNGSTDFKKMNPDEQIAFLNALSTDEERQEYLKQLY
ncbi:DUF4355 domain-containing protein [Priestia megaterium]